jgi:hypothetical protein
MERSRAIRALQATVRVELLASEKTISQELKLMSLSVTIKKQEFR